jgi:hypothetical protein
MGVILFMPEGILGVIRRLRQPAGFHDTSAAETVRTGGSAAPASSRAPEEDAP